MAQLPGPSDNKTVTGLRGFAHGTKTSTKPTKVDERTKPTKVDELERLRQNLAKRSLNVKFDLEGSSYKPIENIGIGAYGVVCSAVHNSSGDRVAIKKIPSIFEALTVAKRTYREIKILKHFKHDNIICIKEILMPKETVKDFKDIYVVFDLMESDLHRIIYSAQELSEEHIRYFLYQILRGLKYIHSANVVHRDLKPSNLLVNEDCHLRIGDFGMARGIFYTPNEPSYYMTQYVATRWYRAPEILLSMVEYGTSVDMWSVGCIFAEMMGRKHLFPGKDYMSQVKLILGILGTPSEALLKNCQNDILKRIIKSFGKKEPVTWSKLFPKASKKSLDLLSKMLVLSPSDRIPVEKALAHRLLNNYHDPDDEPICVPSFNFDFEKQEMDKDLLREVIMDEIRDFHMPRQPSFSFSAFLRPAPKPGFVTRDGLGLGQAPSLDAKSAQDGMPGPNKVTAQSRPYQPPQNPEPEKVSTKKSPVSVDLTKLQVTSSVDIEMLSAQSSDGRAMDLQVFDVQMKKQDVGGEREEPVKDVKEEIKARSEKTTSSTISEDTKALVKQALLNATNRRQRAESQSEEAERVKPVTAAQRQKEREEKRRKKKEKTLEKMKKAKEKKGGEQPSFTLSNQDVELLRRWTTMQNPAQRGQGSPPRPGFSQSPPNPSGLSPPQTVTNVASVRPAQASTLNKPRQILAKATPPNVAPCASVSFTSSQMGTGSRVLIPSSQISLSQTVIPVIAIPSTTSPGKLEIKRIFPQSDVAAPVPQMSNMAASDSTKAMLQNAILMRNQSADPSFGKPPEQLDAVADTFQNVSSNNSVHNITANQLSFHPHPTGSDHQTSGQGDTPEATFPHPTLQTSKLLPVEQGTLPVHEPSSSSGDGSDILAFLNEHITENPSQSSLSDLAGGFNDSTVYTNQPQGSSTVVQSQRFVEHHQPHRNNSSPNLQGLFGQTLSHTAASNHSLADPPFSSYRGDPVLSSSYPRQTSFTDSASNMFTQHSHYLGQKDSQAFSQIEENYSFNPSAHELFTSSVDSQGSPSHNVAQCQSYSHSHLNQDFSLSSNSAFPQTSMSSSSHLSSQQYGSNSCGGDRTGQYIPPDVPVSSSSGTGLYMASQPTTSGAGRVKHDGLTVNCQHPSTSSEADQLISMLSKQLSKSQVVDTFPPTLTLTPRGTGAGYGLGMDLDTLLTDAQDNNAGVGVDESPLSSSLLADWLAISGNISQADLEALEREIILQSPMNISYSDSVNLGDPFKPST